MRKKARSTNAAALRSRLVEIALQWQDRYGVAPQITSAISERDAALRLVGMPEEEYCAGGAQRTAVTKGCDFEFRGCRYQVKANRPSGKPGSRARLVAKAHNYDWDKLIWLLYDRGFDLQEAWEWDVADYRRAFEARRGKKLRPEDMRRGRQLFSAPPTSPGAEKKTAKAKQIMSRYRNTLRALSK